MLSFTGDAATSSSALIPVLAEMQAESREQILTVARQVDLALGGPVAMEIVVHEKALCRTELVYQVLPRLLLLRVLYRLSVRI